MTALRVQPEVPLHVFVGSGARIACWFLEDTADGLRSYDLTGSEVEFIRKARAEAPDPAPLYSTGAGTITIVDAAGGQADIQLNGADLAYPGQSRYHVDAVKDGRRVVLSWGPFIVTPR